MRPHCAWVEFRDQSKRAECRISLWWRKSYVHNSGFSSFLHADLNKKQWAKGRAGYKHVKAYHMESSPFGFWIQHTHKHAPHWVHVYTSWGSFAQSLHVCSPLGEFSSTHPYILQVEETEKRMNAVHTLRSSSVSKESRFLKSISSEPFWWSWGNVVFNF